MISIVVWTLAVLTEFNVLDWTNGEKERRDKEKHSHTHTHTQRCTQKKKLSSTIATAPNNHHSKTFVHIHTWMEVSLGHPVHFLCWCVVATQSFTEPQRLCIKLYVMIVVCRYKYMAIFLPSKLHKEEEKKLITKTKLYLRSISLLLVIPFLSMANEEKSKRETGRGRERARTQEKRKHQVNNRM